MKLWLAIILSSVTVVGFLWGVARERPPAVSRLTAPPLPARDGDMVADMRVRNMSLVAQHGLEPAWQIAARQAMVLEGEQVVRVEQLEAELFDNAKVIRLTAARGVVRRDTGDMTVEGEVNLAHHDGLLIETTSLRWRAADRLLYTDAPVTLHGMSASVTGRGLRSRVDQQRLIIPHQVKASFRLPEPVQ